MEGRDNVGKSILVMDTPDSCCQCKFSGADGDCCCLKENIVSDSNMISEEEYLNKKPDWCPLQDAPKKKDKNAYHNEHERGYLDGWNDCLDQILNEY